jgi:hypothetical protein
MNFGDAFKNGCDFIFAVSTAALTGYISFGVSMG